MTSQARRRREEAADKYKPDPIRLLLIGEAPPEDIDRYFYFQDITSQDALFRYVVRTVLETAPSRTEKTRQLQQLGDQGVFLIDLKREPKAPGENLKPYVADLVGRAQALSPRAIITIKANVCDLTQAPLRAAGLNVAEHRVPFPGSGQQQLFLSAMRSALTSINWPTLASAQ